MKARRGHALFHAIVSMGAASVQACGGVAVDESHAGDGHGAGTGGAAPSSGGADTGGTTSSQSSAGGYANAASGPTFVPSSGGGVTAASSGGSPNASADASAGGAAVLGSGGSTDGGSTTVCSHPEQLRCTTWDPVPSGCSCNLNAPLSAADCPTCTMFQCHSYTPQVGCQCVFCIH